MVGLAFPLKDLDELVADLESIRKWGCSMGPSLRSSHHLHGTTQVPPLLTATAKDQQLPGLGYLYSGLTRRKNALSLLFLCFVSLAVVSFQWFFIGYSLVFSASGGTFLGDGR